jgi:Uma2 family endonuclease
MKASLASLKSPVYPDRPGWIPSHIVRDWNPSPYAYQTEEELMPAGGLHGQILNYLMELLRHFLEQQGLMMLIDTFLLYRDEKGIKQRISPDLILMPFRFPPPSAYDLDVEPPPMLVIEVTSPNSHLKDLQVNVPFYHHLGIPAYLVIDAVTRDAQLREPIEVHLWRLMDGEIQKIKPDRKGVLALPEMGIQIHARQDYIRLVDMGTSQPLRDMEAESRLRRAAEQQAKAARQEADAAKQEADTAKQEANTERQARLHAEARLRELEEKLRKAGLE